MIAYIQAPGASVVSIESWTGFGGKALQDASGRETRNREHVGTPLRYRRAQKGMCRKRKCGSRLYTLTLVHLTVPFFTTAYLAQGMVALTINQ